MSENKADKKHFNNIIRAQVREIIGWIKEHFEYLLEEFDACGIVASTFELDGYHAQLVGIFKYARSHMESVEAAKDKEAEKAKKKTV